MRRLVLLLAVVLILAGCGDDGEHEPGAAPAPTVAASGYPKPSVTPGVVLTTRGADVCTPGWASRHRKALTATQKATVLAAYGYPAGTKVAEWDHLVSLELGGGNGPRNIWPQVNHAEDQRKDRLENELHTKVCAGTLPLVRAQAEVRQFWLYW